MTCTTSVSTLNFIINLKRSRLRSGEESERRKQIEKFKFNIRFAISDVRCFDDSRILVKSIHDKHGVMTLCKEHRLLDVHELITDVKRGVSLYNMKPRNELR